MSDQATPIERIFYDGHCGLCHWAVTFVAHRDPEGNLFRFSPLESETFEREVPAGEREGLPDSIVVLTADRELLVQSSAVLHILRRIGGLWQVPGTLGVLVPRPLRDLAYALFARIRRRLAPAPEGTCPMMPPEMRGRFDF